MVSSMGLLGLQERTIAEQMMLNGYGHRPCMVYGKHEVFTFNTMEAVCIMDAYEAALFNQAHRRADGPEA